MLSSRTTRLFLSTTAFDMTALVAPVSGVARKENSLSPCFTLTCRRGVLLVCVPTEHVYSSCLHRKTRAALSPSSSSLLSCVSCVLGMVPVACFALSPCVLRLSVMQTICPSLPLAMCPVLPHSLHVRLVALHFFLSWCWASPHLKHVLLFCCCLNLGPCWLCPCVTAAAVACTACVGASHAAIARFPTSYAVASLRIFAIVGSSTLNRRSRSSLSVHPAIILKTYMSSTSRFARSAWCPRLLSSVAKALNDWPVCCVSEKKSSRRDTKGYLS